MIDGRRLPLVMFPNGALMRCETVPEGCVLVTEPEPEVVEDMEFVDQTQAVLAADKANSTKGESL